MMEGSIERVRLRDLGKSILIPFDDLVIIKTVIKVIIKRRLAICFCFSLSDLIFEEENYNERIRYRYNLLLIDTLGMYV